MVATLYLEQEMAVLDENHSPNLLWRTVSTLHGGRDMKQEIMVAIIREKLKCRCML